MKRILLAATALCLAGAAAVAWKASRYRRDAQLWHERYTSLRGDPANLARYRDDNERLRRGGRAPNRVVFLGASITESLDLAAAFPGEPLVNRGVGGQLIWQQWLRLEPDALSLEPAAVVIKTCAINMLPGAPPLDDTKAYFARMADAIRARGARVVYGTCVPVSRGYDRGEGDGHVAERVATFNAWVREEARRTQSPLLDYAAALGDAQGYLPDGLSEDGLHPNAEGRRKMLDAIRTVVVDGLVHAPAAPPR
ncbi:MAG: GDSL-type esterase/lipase family protein [Polyangiales bacterium]